MASRSAAIWLLLMGACARAQAPAGVVNIPPPTTAAAPITPKPVKPAPPCNELRVFTAGDPVQMPAPFDAFDACAVVAASAIDGMRIDNPMAVDLDGRVLLAVAHYSGDAAKEPLLCGCCTAEAHISVFERKGDRLERVAMTDKPIAHRGLDGRLALSTAKIRIGGGEALIALEAPHSCGTSPGRTLLHGLRLVGSTLEGVLEWRVRARGIGPTHDVEVVEAQPTNDGARLAFDWRRSVCPFDDKAKDFVCKNAQPIGKETLRFDGKQYRLDGRALKLPFFDD